MSEKIYDVEVARLISEGRLAEQYKVISKRLDSVSKENRNLKRQIEDLEAIIADGKKPDVSVSENGISVGCECGGYHLAKERIAELEKIIDEKSGGWGKCGLTLSEIIELQDRHQSDCIEINRLNVALEVIMEKYMKLREVHGV